MSTTLNGNKFPTKIPLTIKPIPLDSSRRDLSIGTNLVPNEQLWRRLLRRLSNTTYYLGCVLPFVIRKNMGNYSVLHTALEVLRVPPTWAQVVTVYVSQFHEALFIDLDILSVVVELWHLGFGGFIGVKSNIDYVFFLKQGYRKYRIDFLKTKKKPNLSHMWNAFKYYTLGSLWYQI